MKKKVLVEVLDEQASELRSGVDPTAELRAIFEHEPAVIHDLLQLGQRLWRSLPQVEPAQTFVTDLKARLLKRFSNPVSPPTPLAIGPRDRRLLLLVAGIGTLAYAANITALGVKWVIYMLGLAGLVLGHRKSLMPGRRKQRPAL